MKKIILALVLLVLISGCEKQAVEEKTGEKAQIAQIANPASVYCKEQGYQSTNGVCIFPDSSQCKELDFFSGKCGQKFTYCEKHEGKIENRIRDMGGLTSEYAICIFLDNSECEEWAYFRGECPAKEELKKSMNPNPVDKLSDELISKLVANCKSRGTDLEKANCILDGQEKNMFWCYTHPEIQTIPDNFEEGYPDCVVDMQFNQMVPGSFSVSKVMETKIRNGKIFGACYTYATIYCAIARWNGLECRIMWTKTPTPWTYPASKGDFAPGYCGVAEKQYLDKLGLSCDDWRKLDWFMEADHYWAEVLIDGKWKIMEKPLWAYKHDTQKYIIDAGRDYKDTGW